MRMRKSRITVAMLFLGILAGCSSQTSTPAENPQPKPAEFVTGRRAFQELFGAARGWARDAQPFRLESQPTTDSKGQDGKSAVWRATFASPTGRHARAYVWSGTYVSDAPARGILPGSEDTYNPGNSTTQVFDIAFLKVDSDDALKVAQEHGGEKLLQKMADTPVIYALDWSSAGTQLIWHVYYGSTGGDAKLKVDVNASTGLFIHAEK
jgi:hypothetical protein